MRRTRLFILASLVFIAALSSCARMTPSPSSHEGEVRLTKIQVPDSIQDGVPYNVVIEFKSEGEPQIVGACFRWTDQVQQRRIPDIYCFLPDARDDRALWGTCSKWTNQGEFGVASAPYCTDAKDVHFGVGKPSSFTSTLEPRNNYFIYKNVEVYAKYVRGGQIVETNRIYSPVSIHKRE